MASITHGLPLEHRTYFDPDYRNLLTTLETHGHIIVNTIDCRLRPCKYCSKHKIKTKSGYLARTRNKCYLCDVPLCTKNRDCFYQYHKSLFKWYLVSEDGITILTFHFLFYKQSIVSLQDRKAHLSHHPVWWIWTKSLPFPFANINLFPWKQIGERDVDIAKYGV